MATGNTTTDALQDSLPSLIMEARIIREYEGVVPQLVDRYTIGEGQGNTWTEISLAKLEAQAVTEDTVLDNPQQLADTPLNITPTQIGIEVIITDRTAARISKNVFAKTGGLAQNAIQRKKDKDGITMFASGNGNSDPGAGVTLTSGHISSAVSRISSNATEPGEPPFRCVLHGYQIRDLSDEFTAPVGTYNITEGETARVFREGFSGRVGRAEIFEDGNITITSSSCTGGVFAKRGLVLIQGRSPRSVMVRKENVGGGASVVYHYDEYAYGERSNDNWVYSMTSDATAPTS